MSEKQGFCIICRKGGKVLSDEHVIPEAIGGYYHYFNVCKTCNSRLGMNVDSHLLNHWLIIAERHTHRLRGYSGKIPNPLVGKGTLEDGTPVKAVEEKDGTIGVHFIPTEPEIKTEGDYTQFSFSVDAANEKHIERTVKRLYEKLEIDPSTHKIDSNREVVQIEQPTVRMSVAFDLVNFKIGLLKIAYEFTCDQIPEYVDDPRAIEYADILYNAKLERIKSLPIFGDGFSPMGVDIAFADIIDFDNPKRHYLILFPNDGKLYCYVKLFKKMSVVIKMSDKQYLQSFDDTIISINDFELNAVRHFRLPELVDLVVRQSSKY